MTVSVTQPQQPIDDSVHCSSSALLDAGHSRRPPSMALSTAATITNSNSKNNNNNVSGSHSISISNMSSSSSSSASTPSPGPRGAAVAGHPSGQPSPSHQQQQQQQQATTTTTASGTPTSALRRLYFKTARASKAAAVVSKVAVAASNVTTVPKVIVMGSSTASEATINTSTDSTATHITNVTTTTDTEPNDSLDLGDISGQSEPLLSSLDDESSSIVQLHHQTPGGGDGHEEDESLTISNGPPPDTPLLISYQCLMSVAAATELEDMSPRSPMFSPRQSPKVTTNDGTTTVHPRTAPSSSSAQSTRFPFDPPISPIATTTGTSNNNNNTHNNNNRSASFARTHETMFSFDESPNPVRRPPPKLPPPSSIEHTPEHSPNAPIGEFRLPPSSRGYTEPGLEMKGLRIAATSQPPPPPSSATGPAPPPPLDPTPPPPPPPVQSTPKRLMNSFKTRKERFVQQAGSAVAAATAAVTTSGPGKPFKNPNYDPDLTMFPFDREAIDYDRIQRECFAVEEELLFDHDPRRGCCDNDDEEEELDLLAATVTHRLPIDRAGGGDSPSRMLFEAEIFSDHYSIFQQYAYLSQQERSGERSDDGTPSKRNRKTGGQASVVDAFSPKRRTEAEPVAGPKTASKFDQIATKFDMMPSKGGTVLGCGTLPDLRVDYFAETSCCTSSITISPGAEPGLGEPATVSVAVAASSPSPSLVTARAPSPSKVVPSGVGGSSLRGTIDAATGVGVGVGVGAINVTPNPMEGAVCTQPRATIVVQQVRSFVRAP
ncbi:hypothetical protein AND_001905 [Anopheles darlingi]|uniref:Uncharacterized protein n=1 Tax=Anopheles darlingi TaxID=43151 RepID=W5JSJ3_ANODA|nr:hypothetical protein AND_001905 [Anopheles darlingi]